MVDKSTAEKWDLLSALYLHGTKMDALSRDLPHWSNLEIATFVRRYRKRARRLINQDLNAENRESQPLQQWITLLDHIHKISGKSNVPVYQRGRAKARKLNDHSVLLSKVMTYAAYFEDHYNGTGPDDANYSEIYRYLAQLLAGEEPTQLRPASAAKILEMLDKLRSIVVNGDISTYVQNLLTVPLAPQNTAEEDQTPGHGSRGDADAGNQNTNSCPLFEDPANETAELDAQNSLYDNKEDLQKLETGLAQRNKGKEVACLPGVNPMGLPPDLLTKTFSTVPPAPHASYIYKSSGKQPESMIVPY